MTRKAGQREVSGQIAVVEENADNIYSVKFILQSLGYRVQSFSFESKLFTGLLEFSPDLVIVDMMIPAGQGFGVIRGLREGPLKKVPVLAITAEAMQGEEEDVFRAGGQDVLSKPYTVVELQKKLKKWIK